VELQSTETLVDVGCGTGNYTLQFAGKLSDGMAIGVDLSTAMLELLMRHAQTKGIGNIIAIRAPAENLPFKAGSLVRYSMAVCIIVFQTFSQALKKPIVVLVRVGSYSAAPFLQIGRFFPG
jgi:ubiquinone/menaquinone biosynthesis C-methylase UbiE